MSAEAISNVPATYVTPPRIALDFVPRGPHYTQFALRAVGRPAALLDVTLEWGYIEGPVDHEVRAFHRGLLEPGDPIIFTSPGDLALAQLLETFQWLTVTVRAEGDTWEGRIDDLAAEWTALSEAGIVEASDPEQDEVERARRFEDSLDRLLGNRLARPLDGLARAVTGVERAATRHARLAEKNLGPELYVVFKVIDREGEPPAYEFIELEDAEGHGVGRNSGVDWSPHPTGDYQRLGPFFSAGDPPEPTKAVE